MATPHSTQALKVQLIEPGIVHWAYDTLEQLSPAAQEPAVKAIERQGQTGWVGAIVETGPLIQRVPFELPAHWFEVVRRPNIRLVGIGVVSHASSVRLAARSFGAFATRLGFSVMVRSCQTTDEATLWLREALGRSVIKVNSQPTVR